MTAPTRLLVAVDDSADRDALRAVLACAEDRAPKIQRDSLGSGSSRVGWVEATWTRLDSPKREASFRFSGIHRDDEPFPGMSNADVVERVVLPCLRGALDGDRLDDAGLSGLYESLCALALHAALEHDGPPSVVDFCSASAGTPWSRAGAERAATSRTGPILRTMDAEAVASTLPGLPDVVLVRDADFNNRGGARIAVGALHGKAAHLSASSVDAMKACALLARRASDG